MTLDLPRLYLVRHGETEWSRSGQHTGTTDLPLTPAGETMARSLRASFLGLRFSKVLTSPMQRARQTCELAGLGAQAETISALSEWNYGSYEGRTSADILLERPGWDVFRDGCPGGETPAQISDRADALIADLLTLHGNIALFSHGQFGCALAVRWIDIDVGAGVHFTLAAGSVSILGPKPGHPQVRVIDQWNAASSRIR